MRAIISQITNPFANLALETVSFKHRKPAEKLSYIYFNEPCVVIGRNQNPWAECDLTSPLPLSRRRSGGGAVVHDLGNANFCVQFDKEEFSRTKHLDMIVRAFPQLQLRVNKRNDLVIPTDDGERKVSGSSYKLEKRGAYHHATSLLNSDLIRLGSALKIPESQGTVMTSGGTESVRSPVTNTRSNRETFIQGCVSEFRKLYGGTGMELAEANWFESEEVLQEIEQSKSWDWVFGKTPKFDIQTPNGEILRVEKGVVVGTNTSGLAGSSSIGHKMPTH